MSRLKMNAMRAMAAALVMLGSLPGVALAQPTGIKRTDLQRHDLSVPGREAVQVRVDIDPGVAFGRHTHPGEEIIYVLAGSLEYQIEGKPPVTLKSGDVLFIRPAQYTPPGMSVASPRANLPPTSSKKANRSSHSRSDGPGRQDRSNCVTRLA